jgi:hypothetical protein
VRGKNFQSELLFLFQSQSKNLLTQFSLQRKLVKGKLSREVNRKAGEILKGQNSLPKGQVQKGNTAKRTVFEKATAARLAGREPNQKDRAVGMMRSARRPRRSATPGAPRRLVGWSRSCAAPAGRESEPGTSRGNQKGMYKGYQFS